MVQSAVADVVCPAVSAEAPYGLLYEEVLLFDQFVGKSLCFAVQLGGLNGCKQGLGELSGLLAVRKCVQPLCSRIVDGRIRLGKLLNYICKTLSDLAYACSHAQTVLRVVLEQGVGPGRTSAVLVRGVRHGRCGSAPDGGTSCSVGDHHSVAEELGYYLDVRSLAAASAGAGELEVRSYELRTLYCGPGHGLLLGDCKSELPVGSFLLLGLERLHVDGLVRYRADVHAVSAAKAVERAHLHAVLKAFQSLALGIGQNESFRSRSGFLLVQQIGSDGGVRAYERAVSALDALCGIPLGNGNGYAALLVGSGAAGECSVFSSYERAYGQLVAFLTVHRYEYSGDELRKLLYFLGDNVVHGVLPGCGDFHLVGVVDARVHGGVVHVYDVLALLAVGLDYGLLEVLNGLFNGNYLGEVEERGLHDHVDLVAQTDLNAEVRTVYGVEVNVVVCDVALEGCREVLLQLGVVPVAVEQEGAALLKAVDYIVLMYVGLVVARDVVRLGDEVRGLDLVLSETQVGDGNAAGLLGVVGEVSLRVHVGVVADDLYGLLVGADRSVGTESPELAAYGAFRLGSYFLDRQRGHVDVVFDTDGELVLGPLLSKVLVDCDDLSRGGVLGAQTVSSAYDERLFGLVVVHVADVQIERVSGSSGFLGSVEDSDLLYCCGEDFLKIFGSPRSVEPYLYKTDLLALAVQVVDYFLGGVADGAHRDDDSLRVRSAYVIEQLVLSSGLGAELLHVVRNNLGEVIVVALGGLSGLEEYVAVLRGAADYGMFRIKSSGSEFLYRLHVD